MRCCTNLKHNKVLYENNLFVTGAQPRSTVDRHGQAHRDRIAGHDCWQVIVNYGFKNDPDLPKALQQIWPGAATSTP